MNNKELISELSKQLNWSSKDTADMVAILGSTISSRLVDNDSIYFQTFGQFEVKKKSERITVNPVSGKRYLVPPKLSPVFKPGNTFKNKLKEVSSDE